MNMYIYKYYIFIYMIYGICLFSPLISVAGCMSHTISSGTEHGLSVAKSLDRPLLYASQCGYRWQKNARS